MAVSTGQNIEIVKGVKIKFAPLSNFREDDNLMTERNTQEVLNMAKRKLPRGIREKGNGSYEARATVNGIKISICGKDLDKLIIEFASFQKHQYYQFQVQYLQI